MKTETRVRIRPTLKIFQGYPNLIPFLSVFFILLLFFMIGSSFVPVQGFRVHLPQVSAETTYASRNFIVTVDADGALYFNDQPADSPETLKFRISEALSGYGGGVTDLIVRSDVNASVDTLTRLMEIAGELNMNMKIMVDQKQTVRTDFKESE